MPVAPKYSLGTKFTVTGSSPSLRGGGNGAVAGQLFDGYFRRNEQPVAYGLLTWNSVEATKNSYNLSLNQVYVCSSAPGSDYTPLYDPDGTVYSRGPQFGCARDHPSLRHRFLLLDREAVSASNMSTFGAEFVDTKQHGFISDGFRFNTSGLFDLTANTQTDSVWYVHVFFVIRPSNNANNPKHVFNNGTNMQIIRLTTTSSRTAPASSLLSSRVKVNRNKAIGNTKSRESARRSGDSVRSSSYSENFLKIVMPIVISLVFVTFIVASLIYWKREQIHQFLFVSTGNSVQQMFISYFLTIKILIYLCVCSGGRSKSTRQEKANQSMNARSLDLLNYAKTRLKTTTASPSLADADQNDPINTSENYSGSNSTSDTMVVVHTNHHNNANQQHQGTTGALIGQQSPAQNANPEANLTFQTLTNTIVNNSAGSSTLSHEHKTGGGGENGAAGHGGEQSKRHVPQDDENDGLSRSGRDDEDDDDDDGDEENEFGQKAKKKPASSFSLRQWLKRVSNINRRKSRRTSNKQVCILK